MGEQQLTEHTAALHCLALHSSLELGFCSNDRQFTAALPLSDMLADNPEMGPLRGQRQQWKKEDLFLGNLAEDSPGLNS